MRTIIKIIIIAGFLLLLGSGDYNNSHIPTDQSKNRDSNQEINCAVFSNGGTRSSSDNYKLVGTANQSNTGISSSPNYVLYSGFWQNHGWPFICGDTNHDGQTDIADAVVIINLVFLPGATFPYPWESAEVNCDNQIDIGDAVYLVNLVFIPGSPMPCDCE